MSSESKPVADRVSESESASPTVNELIFQLRSSFFPHEFDYVAKTLTDREECMKQKYLDLKLKAKEEIDQLVSENLKLNDELKTKRSEIDDVMKLNADFMTQIRVYEKQVLEILESRKKSEEEKDLLVSENLKINDELKAKQTVIQAVTKVNSEKGRKLRAYEKQYLEDLDFKTKVEKEKGMLVSENLTVKDELKKKQKKIDAVMKVNVENEKKIRVFENRSLEYLEFIRKAEEETLKLNDELKMKQNHIDGLIKLNAEFKEKNRVYEKRSLDCLELKTKADEEKNLLVSENLKLNDELKVKQSKFDAVMKEISEYERKLKVYENRSLQSDANALNSETLALEAVGSGKEHKDCASESYRKQLLISEKEGSKRKTADASREIIEVDDDSEFVAPTKRRQTLNEKTELKYSSCLYKHMP